QLEQRMMAGALWREQDMVFASAVGTSLDPGNLRHAYAWFLRRHPLPRIRFHDLRHTAATTLLGEKEELKIISAVLGHSRIGVTADKYLHVSTGMHASAAKTMDRAIKRADVKWRGMAEKGTPES